MKPKPKQFKSIFPVWCRIEARVMRNYPVPDKQQNEVPIYSFV